MKKYILSGLIGLGISVGCLLPPILHFITGPLGPLIGGFFAGLRARAKWKGAVIIGLTIGTGLTLFLILIGSIIMSFNISLPGMMSKITDKGFPASASLFGIALIPFSIGTVLGTLGAFLGGKVINKEELKEGEPESKK